MINIYIKKKKQIILFNNSSDNLIILFNIQYTLYIIMNLKIYIVIYFLKQYII
jgi:hypothetical protein